MTFVAQQEQVNWDNVASQSIHFTVRGLHRLGRAGMEPFTLNVGQIVVSNLIVPHEVQLKVKNTLE